MLSIRRANHGFLWANTKRDYFTSEAHGYIEEVAVAADGQGAGTLLLEFAKVWALRPRSPLHFA